MIQTGMEVGICVDEFCLSFWSTYLEMVVFLSQCQLQLCVLLNTVQELQKYL